MRRRRGPTPSPITSSQRPCVPGIRHPLRSRALTPRWARTRKSRSAMRRAWCVRVSGAPVVAFGFSVIVPFRRTALCYPFLRSDAMQRFVQCCNQCRLAADQRSPRKLVALASSLSREVQTRRRNGEGVRDAVDVQLPLQRSREFSRHVLERAWRRACIYLVAEMQINIGLDRCCALRPRDLCLTPSALCLRARCSKRSHQNWPRLSLARDCSRARRHYRVTTSDRLSGTGPLFVAAYSAR